MKTQLTYTDLNIFYKFVYNRVDYAMFSEAIKASVPHAQDSYISEKWDSYKSDMIGFLATFEEETFNFLRDEITKRGYRG